MILIKIYNDSLSLWSSEYFSEIFGIDTLSTLELLTQSFNE